MIDLPADQLQIIRDILTKYVPECEVRAFGSRVTWTAKEHSDLDLAVVGRKKLERTILYRLEEALEEYNLPIRVDVLDWWGISDSFRTVIESGYEVLQDGGWTMGGEWVLTTIENIQDNKKGAIAMGPFGSRMKSDCYVEKGIPVIRGTNISGGPAFDGEFVYITEEKADTLGSSNVYQHDLVFPHRGSIGEVGIILEDDRYVLSSSLMKLTCERSKAYPKFIYYFFKSHIGKHELLKNASQVGTPGIGQPLSSLRSIELRLPPLPEQKAISRILGSLDDKIELNRRMNETLEAMAQALFKSWFVDFDPVIDNALAAGNEIPEALKARAATRQALGDDRKPLPEEIRQLFPSSFEFNEEMGWVPEGWEVKQIGDEIDRKPVGKKYSQKTALEGGAIPVLDQGKSGIIGYHNNGPGVLASTSNPSIVFANHTCYMKMIMHDFSDIQNVLPYKGKKLDVYWIYCATLGKQEFIEYKGHWPDFVLHNIVVPKNGLDKVFGDLISTNKISTYERETQNSVLKKLRDTLLPKLLSGHVRIPNAEKLVQKAVVPPVDLSHVKV